MVKLSFNDTMSLTMKAITVGSVAHKFLTNVYQNKSKVQVQISAKSSVYWANNIYNQVSTDNSSFWICIDIYILPYFFCAPYSYEALSNHFHKSITSTSIVNSITSNYDFQNNELFDALSLNNLIFEDGPPLKFTWIFMNFHEKNLLITGIFICL